MDSTLRSLGDMKNRNPYSLINLKPFGGQEGEPFHGGQEGEPIVGGQEGEEVVAKRRP